MMSCGDSYAAGYREGLVDGLTLAAVATPANSEQLDELARIASDRGDRPGIYGHLLHLIREAQKHDGET